MFSAFQSNAYQGNAYQISRTQKKNNWLGGGGDYFERIRQYRADQAQLQKDRLAAERRLEEENALKEQRRLERLARERAILDENEAEIERLQELRQEQEILMLQALIAEMNARLWRLRINEEDILVLLLSLPFVN